MSRVANRFTDPYNAYYYDWQVNHNDEGEFGKDRNITESAPTGTIGLIKQQGEQAPLVLELKGKILHKNQHNNFIYFWQICDEHSIYFRDFAGNDFEVLITAFKPIRKPCARNLADIANMELFTIDYTLRMEVLKIRAGWWTGVTP